MTIIGLIQGGLVNLFVLLGFVAMWGMVRGWSTAHHRPVSSWQLGLLFGGMAVVAMLVPVAAESGMIFDCRAGVMGTAALVGGPLTALAAIPLPCAYRLCLGGVGVVPGIIEIILPAILGSACHLWFHRGHGALDFRRVVAASLFVGLGSNAVVLAFVTTFAPQAPPPIGAVGLVLIMANTPVAMALLSALIVFGQRHSQTVEALADSERRVLHSQKMAAVGQLSRQVAHNFVNGLTAILGHAQLAKETAEDAPRVRQLMDGIIEVAGQISGPVGELLALSSPGSVPTRRMNLAKCIVGIRQILGRTMGPKIEVVIDADPRTGQVEVDPDRIEQAVVHMAVNAAEAIAGHGRLTIRVAPAKLSERDKQRLQASANTKGNHNGPFALLSVEDTGCGMDDETLSRIFEPFFTTKPHEENAGLGLATVYNIVQQHNGCVDVCSRPGHGATFSIYLPVVAP